jgi:hypothetical protein
MRDPCLFCGSGAGRPSTEHVLPKWARDAFDMPPGVTLYAGERTDEPARRKVRETKHVNVTLRGRVCRECNNGFLSRLEAAAKPLLRPMMLAELPTPITLDADGQRTLATWAVKTALLLELAWRQHYPDARPVLGYEASDTEFAWLWRKNEPPPGAFVWIGCWDCWRTTPITYEPSTAAIPAQTGSPVPGALTTFSLGYVAFQVFSIDFLAAEQHGAGLWNTHVPEALSDALARIWPPFVPAPPVEWPTALFTHEDGWRKLVTWNGVLRPGQSLAG